MNAPGGIVRAALVALGVLALAAPAQAEETGGTRSPFASGAGARAVALGGAFTAIGDGLEALEWNPAGLARASRTGFEVARAQQTEIGTTDDYAAFVLPNWRWGVAALAVRHIGVGGIEPRDDRNQVMGGDLSDSETELTLAYAQTLRETWSVGGTVKLQRQSLAGLSATGLGADLGVLAAVGPLTGNRFDWLQGVTAGLAVRNAIEPTLRLDRDNVPDPRLWRAGLAWNASTLGANLVRLALDLDGSAGVAPRLHLGSEVSVRRMMALRAGWRGSHATMGAGFIWHELKIDYAFEDNPVAAVHRIGLSHAFGPTVDERATQTRLAEEHRIQTRLDSEFQRRDRTRFEDLLRGAEQALQREAIPSALEQLAAASLLDSTDQRPRVLEARCQVVLGRRLEEGSDYAGALRAYGRALELAADDSVASAGLGRCRRASEGAAARAADRRERYRLALNALVGGDLLRARAGFAALNRESPADSEAAAMVRRTQEAIGRRLGELLRDARRAVNAQSLDEARQLMAEARALDPRASGFEEVQAAIARATPTATVPEAPSPISPAQLREAQKLTERGVQALAAGDHDGALHYWELSLSINPGDATTAHYVNREYLARGMDAYAAGHLDDAIGFWERARRADPADARAASFLARARERVERTREIFGGQP
jgi:tetratricopeptide (TPR) repeat protein